MMLVNIPHTLSSKMHTIFIQASTTFWLLLCSCFNSFMLEVESSEVQATITEVVDAGK